MTRSGLSLEELRIVEGQGQSSEVITPSEELNRINDMGTAARPSPLLLVNFDLSAQWETHLADGPVECKGYLQMYSYGNETDAVCLTL